VIEEGVPKQIAMVSDWGSEGRGSNPGTPGSLYPRLPKIHKIMIPSQY